MPVLALWLILNFALFSFPAVPQACAAPTGEGLTLNGEISYEAPVTSMGLKPVAFSACVWVKLTEADRSQIFLTMGEPARDWTLYAYQGRVRMLVQTDDDESYSHASAPLPPMGEWVHVAGTCDGQMIRLYFNGKEVGNRKVNVTRKSFSAPKVWIGAATDWNRTLKGNLEDVRIYAKVLTADEVKALAGGTPCASLSEGLAALWDSAHQQAGVPVNQARPEIVTSRRNPFANPMLNLKDDGFRSIWYFNQASGDQYGFKYSGGLGTYPANHYPYSVYRPEVKKTFFCFGGTDHDETTLLHEVSCFDHVTGKLARPTILLDKKTDDAHDNPVMAMDGDGRIWIFSTSHGTGRPSFIHRSVRPYDISEFEPVRAFKLEDGKEVPMTNFSYVQVFHVPNQGFFVFFTTYDQSVLHDPATRAQRIVSFMKSADGVHWSEWKPLAAIEVGHYQNAAVWQDADAKTLKLGSTFNYHPYDPEHGRVGLNWRTNLYYLESLDGGATWQTITGEKCEVPLTEIKSPALVHDYEAEGKNAYIMDLIYDQNGFPIILYLTSNGWRSGPEAGPREWFTCAWNGKDWEIHPITESDNNYDFGSLYVSGDGTWRMVGTDGTGPQAFNTGGEVSQWVSPDRGKTWRKEWQMTAGSPKNHCYPRRPIDWNEDFFAFWADGHGRMKSDADLFFSNIRGDVFRMPRQIPDGVEFVEPEKQ